MQVGFLIILYLLMFIITFVVGQLAFATWTNEDGVGGTDLTLQPIIFFYMGESERPT